MPFARRPLISSQQFRINLYSFTTPTHGWVGARLHKVGNVAHCNGRLRRPALAHSFEGKDYRLAPIYINNLQVPGGLGGNDNTA